MMSGRSAPIRLSGLRTIAILIGLGILITTSSSRAGSQDQLCDGRADYALRVEDYPRAIALHLKLLRSRSHDALAHYHLGFAYAMVGDSAKEVSEYTEAVRFGLNQWDLFMNLGLAYLDQDELGKAISTLEIAVLLGPGHPETHFNLALAYESNHRLPDALWEISASLRLAPNDPDERNTRAIIYAELGDQKRARDEWVRLLQVAPDYTPAGANLAILDRPTIPAPELAQRREGRPLLTEIEPQSLSR
jgi:Flp pilus assembly protein TadD